MLFLVLVPLLLLVSLVCLLPRTSTGFRSTGAFLHGGKAVDRRYAVVIDAGSTGSRVHTFTFDVLEGGVLELVKDDFLQLKPGLSSYAGDAEAAARSLDPLLDAAEAAVPADKRASTRVMVGATAGLRLLPGSQADDILAAVRAALSSGKRTFMPPREEDVSILSGSSEGAFAWLTLNYLLGRLGQPELSTVAAIDLGGGSVQEAFAMTPEEVAKAPKDDYSMSLKGGERRYDVYVKSYLGYGLMAARAAVIATDEPTAPQLGHACIHAKHNTTYVYAGVEHAVVGSESAGEEPCRAAVRTALRESETCGAPQLHCTFAGVWAGGRTPAAFYVSSYFWDRAGEAHIIDDPNAIEQALTPARFADLAKQVCGKDDDEIKATFPKVAEKDRPFFCLDLVYLHQLLTVGFKIPEHTTVTVVKKVRHKSGDIEVAWALGAAINLLGN